MITPFRRGPRTLKCENCHKSFGTASLAIHQKQCLKAIHYKEIPIPKHLQKHIPSLPKTSARHQSTVPKNAFDKPIQPMNKESFLLEETKEIDLKQCRKCRRTFAADRIAKHQSVCKAPKAISKAQPVVSSMNEPPPKLVRRDMPLWKKQHIDFITNVRYAKQMTIVQKQGGDVRKLPPPPQLVDMYADYVKCIHCGRKFNQDVAERHIPKCKNIFNKPKPPPTQIQTRKLPVRGKKVPVDKNKCNQCGSKMLPTLKICSVCKHRR